MIDSKLPHVPYVTAVADALDDLRLIEASYDHVDSDGVMVMEAVLVDVDGYALAWRQTTGWMHGSPHTGVLALNDADPLTTATVPSPDDVATAWGTPGRAPHPCEESAVTDGLLPEALADAVAAGDVDTETAERLAAYAVPVP